MRAWIAVALLAVSWLFGLGYYHQDRWPEWLTVGSAELPREAAEPQTLGEKYGNFAGWLAFVALGTLLLASRGGRLPARGPSALAAVLVLPSLLLIPWPYAVGPALLLLGLALRAAGGDRRAPEWLGATAVLAGCVLLLQMLAILAYAVLTSRSHELPEVLTHVVALPARILGIDLGVHGSTIAMFSMRRTHPMAATWALLVDPASLGFLVGGLVLVAFQAWSRLAVEDRLRYFLRAAAVLLLAMALWLPVRAGLLLALYLNDVLRTDYEMPLRAMRLFWSPWVHLAFLGPAVLLAWRLVRCWPAPPGASRPGPSAATGRAAEAAASDGRPAWSLRDLRGAAPALVLFTAAAMAVAAGIHWDPVGRRAGGRVIVEEYHPDPNEIWERTDRPFDTTWYGHLSGYNYYCIYDYLSYHYDMSRLETPIDDAALAQCDVLVLKVPKRHYAPSEINAVVRFVERGGGLLLIGEHTNVFRSGTYLNEVARRFGFVFRYDCLFGIDTVFDQHYVPPAVPHPVVQHVPAMDFATSCSIAPRWSVGRAVIREAGLKNLTADYHADNYYPRPIDAAEMHYGAFVQLWSMRHGRGRVLAFTDSTIFSNFCTFEPGKAELMLGMVEWLNHGTRIPNPRWWLVGLGVALLAAALAVPHIPFGRRDATAGSSSSETQDAAASSSSSAAVAAEQADRGARRHREGTWLMLIACGLFGWTLAAAGVHAAQLRAMPEPQPLDQPGRPLVRFIMDRTVSSGKLPKNGFISGEEDGFGIFERWILRLGYFTARRSGPPVFDDHAVVFLLPDKRPSGDFLRRLERYVAEGGKVLVIDSARNLDEKGRTKSTAAALLEPFGMTVRHPETAAEAEGRDGETATRTDPRGPRVEGSISGELESTLGWPVVPVVDACVVAGGEPIARVGEKTVAAAVRHGKGTVTVVGFGARFSDAMMGVTGDVEPDEALRKVFEVEYSLLRAIVGDRLFEAKPTGPAAQ